MGALKTEMLQKEHVLSLPRRLRRWGYWVWLAAIAALAVLHTLHLQADFPNRSPWTFDWAKYTDEGWYGNAAVRAHLFGNWYMAGDFNPAVAVPVWPFLEWVLFFFTGVTIQAARGLAVGCFFLNLVLSYLLLRRSAARWVALAGVTLIATSPFLYCFTRLAILEPLQTVLLLAALNLAVRLQQMRRPLRAAAGIGFLFALVVLTKTTGLFLLPAVLWAVVVPLWNQRKIALRSAAVTTAVAGAVYGAWMAWVMAAGLYGDYKYYFFVNKYSKPPEFYWPLTAFWWSLHGLFWVNRDGMLLAGTMVVSAALAWRSRWGQKLWRDPLFGASLWVTAGYVLFMTLQNHPQPRYFAVPAFFCFFVVVLGAAALIGEADESGWTQRAGWATVCAAVLIALAGGARTVGYAAHPQYTWENAATRLAIYIDTHPNGNRLLTSISGDEITLLTHVPSLCDDFGTMDLAPKLADYRPGWYAAWNDLDPGTLEDLHTSYSIEQVASFPAFDDKERDLLILFKLHPLPNGRRRDPTAEDLDVALPGDKIDAPIE